MRGGIEGLLRAADRFQQRHTMFAIPIGVAKKFGDDQAGKHAALLAYYGFVLTGMWVAWRRLLPGAAFGAVSWSVLQALGVYVLDRQLERANLIYGVFAVVIVLLSWLYLSARLLLYSAEVNVVLARRLWPRSLLQPPLTEPDRRVLAALAETEERRPEEIVEVRFSSEADGRHGRQP